MQIITGLFNNMVLQRNKKNLSCTTVSGTCSATGSLYLTVTKGAKKQTGLTAKKIGRASNGTFSATLGGIKAGGPYTITLEIINNNKSLDKTTVKNVLVGDVWILAGQSNMEGYGYLCDKDKPHPLVRNFYVDDHWAMALDPLHQLNTAVDAVHGLLSGSPDGVLAARAPHVGTGPGVTFGVEMHKKSGVPQGLIACAHGGTSMLQWSPALKHEAGRSLYGATMRRVQKNGGVVAGMFWYQGCSDADGNVAPATYTRTMQELIAAVRRDLKSPRLPVVAVQIATVTSTIQNEANWHAIQEAQRLLPRSIKQLAIVAAIDLELDDLVHIAGVDQIRLGRRAARTMAALTGIDKNEPLPIELVSSKTLPNPDQPNEAMVVLTFKNVVGSFTAQGKPWGFEFANNRAGTINSYGVYRTMLVKNQIILRSHLSIGALKCMYLFYGLGRHPYCNIVDRADRALPALGPVYLGGSRVYTPFVTTMQVSPLLPAQDIKSLCYPADQAALNLKNRSFTTGDFCSVREDILNSPLLDALIFFRTMIRCDEAMKTTIHFGYDGPTKVWLDGAEIFCDGAGTNPALPGDASVEHSFTTGEHEIVIALSTAKKAAWGIFLQFSRNGIVPEQIDGGPRAFL